MPSPLNHTILIALFDRELRQRLAAELDLDGYTVHEAPTVTTAREVLSRARPTLLLVGALERPGAFESLLRELRAGHLANVDANLPALTFGPTDTVTQLRAYEDGSDHHLALDIPYVVLRGVVAAVARRAALPGMLREHVEIGALTIDVAARAARVDGDLVQLTGREFDLLVALAKDPTRVFTKAELLSDLWNHHDPRSTRTLDSHASRLRRRLAEHGQDMVCNQWGVGYRLIP